MLYSQDVDGVLVPAAIGMVPQKYARMRLGRGGLRVVYDTPRTGVNLVLFSNRYQELHELKRFHAILQGLIR
jgi:hypothetical protein